MGLEQAKKFVTRILHDKAFNEKFTDASKEERAKLIKDAGYEFTQEELIEARNQVFPGQMDELSSDQLDQVAGGGHCGHTHEVRATAALPMKVRRLIQQARHP